MLHKKLRRLVNLVFEFVPFIISSILPKNPNIWIFGAWFGNNYSDNSKYLFEYALRVNGLRNDCKTQCYWIYKNKTNFNGFGVNFVYCYSIKGIYLQLRSGVAVMSQDRDDFYRPIVAGRTKLVQLWHGFPLKKIGADARRKHSSPLKETVAVSVNNITEFIFPFTRDRYDIVVAASDYDAEIFAKAFRVERNRVKITGYPRNDALVASRLNSGCQKNVIYLPTFRGLPGSGFDVFLQFGFNAERIDFVLKSLDIELHIKMHPAHSLSGAVRREVLKADRIKFLDSGIDLYTVLPKYEILITDYSSVYVDYLLLGGKILLAQFDLDSYIESSRDSYMKFDKLPSDAHCGSWREIEVALPRVLGSHRPKVINELIEEQVAKFHRFTDSNSSSRVYEVIQTEFK